MPQNLAWCKAVLRYPLNLYFTPFAVFSFVQQATVSLSFIVFVNGCVLAGIFFALRRGGKQFSTHGLMPDTPIICKYVAIFIAVLFGSSPILQTLTQAFCNDTIWGCCILLFSVHVCNHEYQVTSSSSVWVNIMRSLITIRSSSSIDIHLLSFLPLGWMAPLASTLPYFLLCCSLQDFLQHYTSSYLLLWPFNFLRSFQFCVTS